MKLQIRKASVTFIVFAELGIISGIILAFFFVPEATPARTFWIVAALYAGIANCYFFIAPQKDR